MCVCDIITIGNKRGDKLITIIKLLIKFYVFKILYDRVENKERVYVYVFKILYDRVENKKRRFYMKFHIHDCVGC